jgi:hypothetical protein
MPRRALPAVLALAALLGAGCVFEVSVQEVRDPRPAFEAARREAARLQGRRGRARDLNVLVYDPGDRKLVRACVPLWLVRKIGREIERGSDESAVSGPEGERVERILRRRVRMEEIERAGLGILVEVEEDDGGLVLVWLR